MNEKLQPTPAQDRAMKEISKLLMTLPTPGDALVVLSTLAGVTLSMADNVTNEVDAREAIDLFGRATLMTWGNATDTEVDVESGLPPWPAGSPDGRTAPDVDWRDSYDALEILLYRCQRCLEEAKVKTNAGDWPDDRLASLRGSIERFEAITHNLDAGGRKEVNNAIEAGTLEGIEHLHAAFKEMGV